MTGLATLIVDDEPVARRLLRQELEQLDGIGAIAEAEDGGSALAAIRKSSPDLVFLDLQMPGMSGFDVIRKLEPGDHVPVIVIVTAWEQHAIEAFEAGAIDYLLKPVAPERLAMAVERAMKFRGRFAAAAERLASTQETAERSVGRAVKKIVAKAGKEFLLLDAREVLAFEADGELVWIITVKKRLLATHTLKALQERLHETNFRRVHRKALVNIDHVRRMTALSSQRWLLTLSNGQDFIVSKRQAGNVRAILNG